MSGLPDGWSRATVGDTGRYINGLAFKPTDWTDSGRPIIRIQNLSGSSEHFNRTERQVGDDFIVRGGDILVSWSATLDAFRWAGPEAVLNQHIFKVVPTDGVDPTFLFHGLRVVIRQMAESEHTHGATMQHINRGPFLAHPFPLPTLTIQRRIAGKLDDLQSRSRRAKEALDAIPPLLERFRQSVLAAAFRGDLTADWRAKNPDVEPASELLKRIRIERRRRWEEAELAKMQAKGKAPTDDKWKAKYEEPEPVDAVGMPNLPPGWCWTRLACVADFINGDRGKDYPNQSEYVPSGLPFINTGHIRPGGTLSLEAMHYITRAKFDSLGGGKIRAGDLVYCLRGATLGKTAFVEPFAEGAIASSLVIVRPDDARHARYLYHFLVSPSGREEIKKYDNGSAQPNLSANSLSQYLLPMAPEQEIPAICDRVRIALDGVRSAVAALDSSRVMVNELDRAILAKAFRGELVPQDPNDEPAEAMLARPKTPTATDPEPESSASKSARPAKRPGRPRKQ